MSEKVISNTFTVNTVEDALSLVLETYAIAFPTDSNYTVGSALSYTVGAKMFLGNDTQQTITSISTTSSDGGVNAWSISNGVRIAVGEERFVNSVTVTVTAVCSVGSRTATINLTPTPQGVQGARGKIGRFFYFGGEFNSSDNTTAFLINDAQAPYFEHTEGGQKRYHVFNPDETPAGGLRSMAQMWTASQQSWNNAPWEVMTNDFKYIITEALFGAYAHLGSFIINGDWMISQHGTINGQASTNYTQFDPDHPNDNTGTNFIPYFAVDGLTGKSYQNDAYVNGTIISEGSANSRWEISPELSEGSIAIPRIIGYSTGGEKRMQLIFDADDSDTVQVAYGGGLSFIEQEAGVGDVTAAGYFKTAWKNSNSDNYNSSYIRATSDPSEPRIEFQSTVNSGKYLKVGVDTSGVLLSSTNWPSYSSNFLDGRVYIDANGYLKVKGQRQSSLLRASANTQLDGNYDTIVAVTAGITITFPSNPVHGQKFTIIPNTSCHIHIGKSGDHIIHPSGSSHEGLELEGVNQHYVVYDSVDKRWYLSWCN